MLTTEELLKLKEAYAAWFEPGDEMDLSEVADDITKLVDELIATRAQLAAVPVDAIKQTYREYVSNDDIFYDDREAIYAPGPWAAIVDWLRARA